MDRTEDKVSGLRLGAVDYITKPFEAEELVLKIHNILKRAGKEDVKTISLGCLHIKLDELVVEDGHHTYNMTPRESELLKYLIEHRNILLKREEILKEYPYLEAGDLDEALAFAAWLAESPEEALAAQ